VRLPLRLALVSRRRHDRARPPSIVGDDDGAPRRLGSAKHGSWVAHEVGPRDRRRRVPSLVVASHGAPGRHLTTVGPQRHAARAGSCGCGGSAAGRAPRTNRRARNHARRLDQGGARSFERRREPPSALARAKRTSQPAGEHRSQRRGRRIRCPSMTLESGGPRRTPRV
jgi:hypothetical protein